MTDIAILVAEEFERRVKMDSINVGSCEKLQVMDLVSGFSELTQSLLKKKIIGNKRMELLNWVMEPKTQIGLAASNGFFSA